MRIATRISLVSVGAVLCAALALPLAQVSAANGDNGKISNDPNQYMSLDPGGSGKYKVTDGKIRLSEAEIRNKLAEHNIKLKSVKDKRRSKFSQTKLSLCQKRQTKVVRNMDRTHQRAVKQTGTFDRSTMNTQAFITRKGLTVPNYDALLKDIADKKTTAEVRLQALQAAKADFKCDGETSGGATVAYQTALKDVNFALKDYRNSIRNLLKAAKQAHRDKRAGTTPATPTTPTTPPVTTLPAPAAAPAQ